MLKRSEHWVGRLYNTTLMLMVFASGSFDETVDLSNCDESVCDLLFGGGLCLAQPRQRYVVNGVQKATLYAGEHVLLAELGNVRAPAW